MSPPAPIARTSLCVGFWSPELLLWRRRWGHFKRHTFNHQLLLWSVWRWQDLCTRLDNWIRILAVGELTTLSCRGLWYWRLVWKNRLFFSSSLHDCDWITDWCLLNPGVIKSPNHSDDYPDNLDKKEQIIVETGKLLRLEFTTFAVSPCGFSCDATLNWVHF